MDKGRVALALLMVFSGRMAAGSDAPELRPRVFMSRPAEAIAVQRAVKAAAKRLADDRCQQVFSDFADGSGRPLRDRLAEMEQTGVSYLGLVRFNDGSGQSRCSQPGVAAATKPGSRVVFVCGREFQRGYEKNPTHAEALIIHETLHSLGLGENPPTSSEITARVMERCR